MIEIMEKEFLSGKKDLEIKKALETGEVVIFPSESSYGFGANCLNESAVKKIHETKKESFDKPIGLVTDSSKKIENIVEMGEAGKKLLSVKFSGQLTILLREKAKSPCSSNELIGVRIPSNKSLLRLCSLVSFPLTATSANINGEAPIFSPKKIKEIFGGEDFIFINAGTLKENKPSTYYNSATGEILREGKVTLKEIKKVLEKN
ncbi:MAG: L-threonylcarbamoyladenylate synthase [archaeon]|jgi:L-threonylcarbamoyladenylate synthase